MEEPKKNDKVRIVCNDGHASSAEITIGGHRLNYVEGVKLEIKPNEPIKASLETCFNELDIEAEIEEIINKDLRVRFIKNVVDDLPELVQINEGDADMCITAIKVIRGIISGEAKITTEDKP